MNIHHGGAACGQAHPNARNQSVQLAGIKPAANVNMLEITGSTSRIPPAWGPQCEATYPFREYVKDLMYWTMGTDVEPHRQASLVIQRLSGPAMAKAEAMFDLDADLIAWGASRDLGDGQGQRRIGGDATIILDLQEVYGEFTHETSVRTLMDLSRLPD